MSKRRPLLQFVPYGATRQVLLVGAFAVKVPRLTSGWRMFLCGLLCNQSEAGWGRLRLPGVCPSRFAVPGGWLLIQPRARLMTDEEFAAFDYDQFVQRGEYVIPAEPKSDSFGWLNGEVVALDFGEVRIT